MSPTKTNALDSVSSRPRKVSTQKQRRAFKQRKIPKALDKVPLYIYGAKFDDFINGDTTIQPPAVSESLAPSSLHVSTPKDTVNLTSYFPPANFIQFQIPISTEVYREAEPSHWHVPSPFQYGPDFNSQAEDDNISSLTNNPCHSCGRYGPTSPVILSSSSTGSLSMEDGGEPFQQLLDPYTTQYFTIPQPILPYVSNVASSTFKSLGNSHNIYTEIVGSPHLTMTPAIDETAIPQAFPDYDANSSHNYYM